MNPSSDFCGLSCDVPDPLTLTIPLPSPQQDSPSKSVAEYLAVGLESASSGPGAVANPITGDGQFRLCMCLLLPGALAGAILVEFGSFPGIRLLPDSVKSPFPLISLHDTLKKELVLIFML